MINYWWQLVLSITAIVFGIIGMHTAKQWNWLKSGVGTGTFFISLGLVFWGIGQCLWTYYLIRDPNHESPSSIIMDIGYFLSIPMWAYGILRLSEATGAKYGLKETRGRISVVVISTIMIVVSYYFLVVLARGGTVYFSQSFQTMFFDLGYAIGDAINFTMTLVIVTLSWKLLGGKFRPSILLVLASFGIVYIADFMYSYYDGKGWYYNGDVVDLPYLLMLTTFAIGLSMLDPSHKIMKVKPKSGTIGEETVVQNPAKKVNDAQPLDQLTQEQAPDLNQISLKTEIQ